MKSGFLKKIISAGTAAVMITATISATTLPVVGAPDANGVYFKNSFENGTDNWTNRGGTSVSVNNRNFYDGSGSLLISGRTADWNGASITLDASEFVPGQAYSFSAAVMQKSGGNVPIQPSLQQGSGDTVSYSHIADVTTKSGEWTKLENTTFTIPSNTGDMILYVETPESSSAFCDIYLDAVQVAQAGTASSVETGRGTVSQQQATDTSYKIMPIGDSITFGYGEAGGYRKYLDYALEQKGYANIDMVGPEGPDTASFNYNGQNYTYDNNNAGYSGYTIKQQYPIPSWGKNGLLEKLQEKAGAKPVK